MEDEIVFIKELKQSTAEAICNRLCTWIEEHGTINCVLIPYEVPTLNKELLIEEIEKIRSHYRNEI
jgi:hypothetical protein